VGGEEQRDETPGQAVVEVVDQPGLRARAQRRLAIGRACERVGQPRRGAVGLGLLGLLERNVPSGVADR
jgi:hypothetical protein